MSRASPAAPKPTEHGDWWKRHQRVADVGAVVVATRVKQQIDGKEQQEVTRDRQPFTALAAEKQPGHGERGKSHRKPLVVQVKPAVHRQVRFNVSEREPRTGSTPVDVPHGEQMGKVDGHEP